MTIELLNKEQHDDLKFMFPEVKSRCPVCYIEGAILRNIEGVFLDFFDFLRYDGQISKDDADALKGMIQDYIRRKQTNKEIVKNEKDKQ